MPGQSAPSSSEGGQGGRVADAGASCAYCVEDLDFSRNAGNGHAPAPVTRADGAYVNARCMLDRGAERLANGHAVPQPVG